MDHGHEPSSRSPASRICSSTSTPPGSRTPRPSSSASGNGAHGIIDNYFNIPDAAAQNALELFGTKGSIIARGTIGQDPTGQMFSILQAQETGYDANQVRDTQANRQEYKLEGIGIYGQMITLFTDCILQDQPPPTSLADGRHSVKVVNAIYQAVRDRRVVEVRA